MKISIRHLVAAACTVLSLQAFSGIGQAAPAEQAPPDSRCSVCGMFVAKYPAWLTQIRHQDGTLLYFDGVKDMMAYYFHPDRYGSFSRETIQEVWVKDYYTLEWIDGRQAFFVKGSDVYGPMGHELIAFSSRPAAESFQKDHQGERVYGFEEVTPALIESMRMGQKMKMEGHHQMSGHGMEGHHMTDEAGQHTNGHQQMHH